MSIGVWHILDLVDKYGEDAVCKFISDFSTKKKDCHRALNPDIEVFLKRNAIRFAREKKSITYLVYDEDDGSLLGYFTLAHKPIEIPTAGLSNSVIKKLEKYARPSEEHGEYTVSAFLIAQFGKNYAVDDGKRITGDELMKLCNKELFDVQHRIGGGLEYLDCESDAKLIDFYHDQQHFRLFGERISNKDSKRYLQFMRFI